MNGKLKALRLVFVAALALSAVAASGASAAETHSGSGSGNTYYTPVQHATPVLHTPSGDIKCLVLTGHAKTAGSTANEGTLTDVAYDECTAFGLSAHIDVMGCVYTLTAATSTTGVTHIVCPTTGGGVTDEITVTPTQGGASICHIDFPEQTVNIGISNTSATPNGTPQDIDITPQTNDTITYTVERTPGGSKCPTEGHHDDGVYTGSITTMAFENAAHNLAVNLTYT